MGRNEIRLRRHLISSGRIAHHRNYGEVMARHERDMRIKRIVRLFIYFLIIAFMIILFLMVKQWEGRQKNRGKAPVPAEASAGQPGHARTHTPI